MSYLNSKIIQIQAISVPNVETTQCYVFMYALCEDGSVWFKRDNDTKWTIETEAVVARLMPNPICETAPYPQCNGAEGCDTCEHQPEE